jgi:hypothetical protein
MTTLETLSPETLSLAQKIMKGWCDYRNMLEFLPPIANLSEFKRVFGDPKADGVGRYYVAPADLIQEAFDSWESGQRKKHFILGDVPVGPKREIDSFYLAAYRKPGSSLPKSGSFAIILAESVISGEKPSEVAKRLFSLNA